MAEERESLILSKLRKWSGKSCIPWETTIAAIETSLVQKQELNYD